MVIKDTELGLFRTQRDVDMERCSEFISVIRGTLENAGFMHEVLCQLSEEPVELLADTLMVTPHMIAFPLRASAISEPEPA